MIEKILKLLFGDKSEKDIKEIKPYVDKTLAEYAKLRNISSDELRAKSIALKQKIKDFIRADEQQIIDLKKKAEDVNTDIQDKEAIFNQIEALEKTVDEKLEKVLLEVLPEAFAIVKETARRFAEDHQITVTATELDKTLATSRKHIVIDGDKATWKNKWDAAGTEIEWNMVHYDVQLIGGTALHLGKIAEMATGEGKTLVATLPVFLNALSGKGVHLVTVNDYLAKRDSEWMAPLYQFHGLTVDCIDNYHPKFNVINNPVRVKLDFSPDTPVAIFVGSGFTRKGLDDLLEALVFAVDWQLLVIGKDKKQNRFIEKSREIRCK